MHRHRHRREVLARDHPQPDRLLRREGFEQERRLDQPDHQLRQRHERLRGSVPGEQPLPDFIQEPIS